MNGEERKILISSILIIITLILVVVGTTYAFFSLQIQNSSEPTNIEITTGEQNEITLSGGITGYHINLDVSDMTKDKIGTPYYGTVSGEKYELTEEAGTQDIGTLTKTGTLTEKYSCSVGINITLDGDMKDELQANDLVLVVKQGSTSSTYDLSEETTKYTFRFKLDNDNINPIQAYLKFTNQESDQSDLAGTSLNISINIDSFACSISVGKEPLEMLREHAVGGEETTTFTEEDVDGMYRYKGASSAVTNNYICFGTTDKDECLATPKTYMYRIIGITDKEDNTINLPSNSLKLIKATPSSESQLWHSAPSNIKWDSSAMKSYLNTTFYNSIKDAKPNGAYWDSIILNHSWYSADQPDFPFKLTEEPKTSHTTESKISLMYATDYMNAGTANTSNWLHIKNGWSTNSTLGDNAFEWTMSRFTYLESTTHWYAWDVSTDDGSLKANSLDVPRIVRPVFYVSPIITLTGEGNAENPFIIHY